MRQLPGMAIHTCSRCTASERLCSCVCTLAAHPCTLSDFNSFACTFEPSRLCIQPRPSCGSQELQSQISYIFLMCMSIMYYVQVRDFVMYCGTPQPANAVEWRSGNVAVSNQNPDFTIITVLELETRIGVAHSITSSSSHLCCSFSATLLFQDANRGSLGCAFRRAWLCACWNASNA